MTANALIQVRVDPKLKSRAAKLFSRLGLSTSEAIRLFLAQSIEEQGCSFNLHVPNKETLKAIRDVEAGRIFPTSLEELAKDWKNA
jgi:DNA-damage-inducible protein J